jgi:hypothetical protein
MGEQARAEASKVRLLLLVQLGCGVAVLVAAALRLPATVMDVFGGVNFTLYSSPPDGPRAVFGAVMGTALALAQLPFARFLGRDGSVRSAALVLAVLGLLLGVMVAYGAYRAGFVPALEDVDTRPGPAAVIALAGGSVYGLTAIYQLVRLRRALRG